MDSYILLTLSLLNLFVSTLLYKKVAETLSPRRLNIISFFYYYFIVLSFIGSLLLTFDVNSFYLSSSLKNSENSMRNSWLLINLVLILTPSTALVIQKIIPKKESAFMDYCEKDMSQEYDSDKLFKVITFLTLISTMALIYVLYMIGFSKIPILNALTGASPQELAVLRQLAGRGFKGNIYIKNFLAFGLMPLLSYVAFVEMNKTKNKKWIGLFFVLLAGSTIILTFDLQKAPILRYLFTYFILIQLFKKPISVKHFQVGLVGLVSIILIFYVFLTPTPLNEIFSFNRGPVNRVLKSQVFPTYLHLDIFPEQHDFLNGASFPSVISENVFGLEHKRSGRLVMEIIRPEAVKDGTAGVLNTLYVAEAYANFSWLGAVFSIVWVSAFLYLTHLAILIQRKTPITIALYAYLANLLVNATQGGFVDFMYNPGLIFILLVVISASILIKPKQKPTYFD